MKRLSLILSAASLLYAPVAFAAFEIPSDLLEALQSDASPRAINMEAHVKMNGGDGNAMYLSLWAKGRTQGRLADAKAELSITLDMAAPASDAAMRTKMRIRVADGRLYSVTDSMAGTMEGQEILAPFMANGIGKWTSAPMDHSLAEQYGLDLSDVFGEDVLKMVRTQGKDGASYSVTMDRSVALALLQFASVFDPSVANADPAFNFHAVVNENVYGEVMNARMYVSLEVPSLSFVALSSSERLDAPFEVRVPANAMRLEDMLGDFSIDEDTLEDIYQWENGVTAPTSPRSAGADKYGVRAAARALREKTSKPRASAMSVASGDLTFGDANAPVTITEYTDYQCPFCLRFQTMTYPLLKEKYIDTGKVRFVIRHYPLSFHEHAMDAALAVKCAQWQGNEKGQDVSEAMWILQQAENQLTPLSIRKYAMMAADLDASAFAKCLASDEAASAIRKDIDAGDAQEVTGTPSFFLRSVEGNESRLDGAYPFADFQEEIESLLDLLE